MAADPTKSPTPESPTTARPLEMDDDDVQDASLAADDSTTGGAKTPTTETPTTEGAAAAGTTPKKAATDTPETATPAVDATDDAPPPPKPPRPMTEQQKREHTLQEAFPTVDLPVIKAVLTASRGNIEAAFHALLQMTDPDAVEREPTPPPPPPRPTAATHPDPAFLASANPAAAGRLSPNSQLRADEEYARRLAQHYETEEGDYEARTSHYGPGGDRGGGGGRRAAPTPRRYEETGLKPNEMWGDKEHSFLDDDLPVIRENLRKGFVDTQNKFNTWFTGIKKRIDEEFNTGDDDDDDDVDNRNNGRQGAHAYGDGRNPRGGSGVGGGYGRSRRSGDYDADPEVLSDDFAGIQLHGDGISAHNPNLFRPPQASSPRPSGERKVAFLSEVQDEPGGGGDIYRASPKVAAVGAGTASPGSGAKTSKWQPMSAVDPAPIAENDPFSLGDSEDEKDTAAVGATTASTKKDVSKTEGKTDDEAERLRKAAAEAMADSLVEDSKPKA